MSGRAPWLLLLILLSLGGCTKTSSEADAGRRVRRAKREGTPKVLVMVAPSSNISEQLRIAMNNRGQLEERKAALAEIAKSKSPTAVYPLATALDIEPEELQNAVRATLRDLKAAELLIDDLDNGDLSLRQRASLAMFFVRDPSTIDSLVDALLDEDLTVRTQAASALRVLGDSRAVDPLLEMLVKDPEADGRSAAAQALGAIGGPAAMAGLAKAEASEQDDYVKVLIKKARTPN